MTRDKCHGNPSIALVVHPACHRCSGVQELTLNWVPATLPDPDLEAALDPLSELTSLALAFECHVWQGELVDSNGEELDHDPDYPV